MKLTDLKSPYRELAEMRREQKPFEEMERNFLETNYLYLAFVYDYTKEGYNFWECVNYGKSPDIPKSSLDELSEWQKGKEPKGIDLKAMEQKIDKLLEGETEESMTDWLMKKILIGILLFAMVSGIPFASILIAKFVSDFNVDGGGFAIAQGLFLIFGLIVSLSYYTQND